MKNFLTVILAIIMVLSFAACGGNNSTSFGDGTNPNVPVQNKVSSKPEIFGEDDVIEITESNFSYKLTYTKSKIDVEVTGFDGFEEIVSIPKTVKGYVVTAIGNEALKGHYETTSITMPNSITARGICLWIEASKRGYRKAWEELYREYEVKTYRNLGDELKLFFLFEIFSQFLEYKNLPLEEDLDKIDEQDRLTLKKIYNEGKRLQKTVYEKANLRSLTTLFWDVDEGPYKIDF